MNFWLILILLVLGILAALTALVFISAHVLTRRRPPDPADPPSNYGIDYKEVQLRSRDETPLVGWWIPAEGAPLGTVVMCHGMSGSMDGDTRQMVPLHRAGFNVLMFNLRAHGRSGGKYVTLGMYEKEDILGAVDFLALQYEVKQVGLFAFSMGAGAALIAACSSDRIATIVADGCFARFKVSMARWLRQKRLPLPFWIAWQVAAWALALASLRTEGRIDQIDPILWARHVRCPALFIHGGADVLITEQDTRNLVSECRGQMWLVPGAAHRGAYELDPAAYNQRVIAWLSQYLGGSVDDRPYDVGRS